MSTKVRPEFKCHQCHRHFGQVVDLDGDPVLLLECPYCGAQCKVDLAPHRTRIVEVMRGGAAIAGMPGNHLPASIPTFPPEANEPGQGA